MEKLTDKGWQPGIGDFLLLRKATIPARPMLPSSPQEQKAQRDFIEEVWNPMNPVG